VARKGSEKFCLCSTAERGSARGRPSLRRDPRPLRAPCAVRARDPLDGERGLESARERLQFPTSSSSSSALPTDRPRRARQPPLLSRGGSPLLLPSSPRLTVCRDRRLRRRRRRRRPSGRRSEALARSTVARPRMKIPRPYLPAGERPWRRERPLHRSPPSSELAGLSPFGDLEEEEEARGLCARAWPALISQPLPLLLHLSLLDVGGRGRSSSPSSPARAGAHERSRSLASPPSPPPEAIE